MIFGGKLHFRVNSGTTNNNSNGNPRFLPRNVEPRRFDPPFASICCQIKQKGHNSSALSQKSAQARTERPFCTARDGQVMLIDFCGEGAEFKSNEHVTGDFEKGPSGQD